MAVVLDASLPAAVSREITMEVMRLLKAHSEVFRNVRVNCIRWEAGQKPTTQIIPMPVLMMGRGMWENAEPEETELEKTGHGNAEHENMEPEETELEKSGHGNAEHGNMESEETELEKSDGKPAAEEEMARTSFDELLPYLKLYHARSKLIFVITDGHAGVKEPNSVREAMKPFLERKLILLTTEPDEMELKVRYRIVYPLR